MSKFSTTREITISMDAETAGALRDYILDITNADIRDAGLRANQAIALREFAIEFNNHLKKA